jgi:hypothetical protein
MKLGYIHERIAIPRLRICRWCNSPLSRSAKERSYAWARRMYCNRQHAGLASKYGNYEPMIERKTA